MAAESIREWLDEEVKPGFGAKFASAFEETGLDDKSDLHDLDDELMATLGASSCCRCARSSQKDQKAIEAIIAPRAQRALSSTRAGG